MQSPFDSAQPRRADRTDDSISAYCSRCFGWCQPVLERRTTFFVCSMPQGCFCGMARAKDPLRTRSTGRSFARRGRGFAGRRHASAPASSPYPHAPQNLLPPVVKAEHVQVWRGEGGIPLCDAQKSMQRKPTDARMRIALGFHATEQAAERAGGAYASYSLYSSPSLISGRSARSAGDSGAGVIKWRFPLQNRKRARALR